MQSKSQNEAGVFAQKFNRWLEAVGLQFNPFDRAYLDSGADANLHTYLVGHDAFAAIWHDSPSYVFAPVGGGKTAFRVRLTRACRVGEDDRHVFPVVYKMTSPDDIQTSSNTIDPHLVGINRAIASELLLTLAYRPERYFSLDSSDKASVRQY